jgi:hypothetical protein
VLYLQNYQLLPEKRLATLMADLFGVNLARDDRADQPGLCQTVPELHRDGA